MYCPKCEFEIQSDNQYECPVCGSSLIEFSGEEIAADYEVAGNELKLKELIADVKRDLEALPGEANITLQSGNAVSANKVLSSDMEDRFMQNISDENVFFLNPDTSGSAVMASQAENPFGHDTGEEVLNTFDLEKELNLRAEEKQSLLEDANPSEVLPQASTSHAHEETTEELLEKTLDELDQLHPLPEKPSTKRIPAFILIGVITICAAAGSLFYLTSKHVPPPVSIEVQPKIAEKKATAFANILTKENENKASIIQKAATDNTTTSGPSAQAEEQKPRNDKAEPALPTATEKAQENRLPSQAAKAIPVAAPAEKTIPAAGAEKKQGSIYAVHTDSYKIEQTAVREINRLRKSGFDSYLQTADLKDKGVWQRVLTGKFSSPEEALKVQQALKKKYNKIDARIILIEP